MNLFSGSDNGVNARGIATALGINKNFSFRLIAVGFHALNDGTASNSLTELEFIQSSTSFMLNSTALKPARVRVPKRDYVAGQWFQAVVEGSSLSITGAFGVAQTALNSLNLFQLTNQTALDFVDVAIHY